MSSRLKTQISLLLQFIKLSLLSSLIFLIVLAIALTTLTWIYRDNIKSLFIQELNKNLKTETVIGDIGVNFFRNFPKVAVTLNDVVVIEAAAKIEKDTLLNARRVYFQFNIFDIIKKQYNIKQLEISLAEFNPVIFKDGSANYIIWDTKDDTEYEDSDFRFDLEKVLLRRVKVNFVNYNTDFEVNFMADRAELNGKFSNMEYMLGVKGNLFTEKVRVKDNDLIKYQRTEVDVLLNVVENKLFIFQQGGFIFNEHGLNITGEIDLRGEHSYLDILLESKKLKLYNLLMDLPAFISSYFEDYRIRGDLDLKCRISGTFSNIINPYIAADFGVANAFMSDKRNEVVMKNLSFTGNYNNGRFRSLSSSSIAIRNLKTSLNNGYLEGDLLVMNFTRPNVELILNSNIEFADIINFFKIENFTDAKGQLSLDLNFIGTINDGKRLQPNDILSSTTKGKLNFNGLNFKLLNDNKEYKNFSGSFIFNNNDIVVESFKGNVSSSDFDARGYFRNFLSFVLFDDQKLHVDASLKSNHLNFSELLHHEVSEADTTYKLQLPKNLNFRLDADINNLIFKDFEASNIKGKALLRDRLFVAENITFSTMEGVIDMNGVIDGKDINVLKVNCLAKSDNININHLFYQMGNFGQDAITDKHLRGKLNSTIKFSANWSPFLEIDDKSIIADADLRIENGELINFTPILKLSRFLNIGDLEHINFSTLENQISIKDQTIHIPFMEINSSAINIKLEGEHHFNNVINYRLQVLLSDLFARRSRQSRTSQDEFGYIVDDGQRRTLYLLVSGTIDDPVFRYDTRALRDKIRDDFRKERKNLREILREEFRISPKDTIDDFMPEEEIQRIKERKEIKKREEGDFIIEWD